MNKITSFIYISADGFFAGPNGEMDWFKVIKPDKGWEEYSHDRAKSGTSTLIFGRTTYEIMKSWWPSEAAIQLDPEMAKVVNENQKIVFSKTLKTVGEGPNWKNIRLLHEINRDEIIRLKDKSNMTILGSGSIVKQFANLDLIDEYSLVVVPVILKEGKPLFKNVKLTNLHFLESRSFDNGLVLLRYQPERESQN